MSQENRELTGYNRRIVWTCRIMTAVGAVTLAIMMFLSVADICGRFFSSYLSFSKPITGTYEMVALMVVAVGCLGLGYCQLVKGNIMIDIFTKRLSPRGQAVTNAISYIIAICICSIVVWQVALRTHEYIQKKLGATTIYLSIPLWPFMALMVVCFAWVTVIFCIDLYKAAREVFRR